MKLLVAFTYPGCYNTKKREAPRSRESVPERGRSPTGRCPVQEGGRASPWGAVRGEGEWAPGGTSGRAALDRTDKTEGLPPLFRSNRLGRESEVLI